jgi:nuclear pore complex protein Nup50
MLAYYNFVTYSVCFQKTPFGNFKGFSSTPANKPNFNFIVAPNDSKSVSNSNGTVKPKSGDKSSSEYFHQLKSLNVSVSAWIAKHVQSNPFCILTPVFKDYERHLANIESNRPNSTATEGNFINAIMTFELYFVKHFRFLH